MIHGCLFHKYVDHFLMENLEKYSTPGNPATYLSKYIATKNKTKMCGIKLKQAHWPIQVKTVEPFAQ